MKRFDSNHLSIENLEGREMMAADAVLAGGVLNITGTEQADRIIVSQVAQNGLMTVKVSFQDATTLREVSQKSFFNGSVSSIKVDALGGNDTVENNTNKPSVINGGLGVDQLVGGSASDTIHASSVLATADTSSNTLIGNGGNDILYGGNSNDTLEGGAGDDSLYGLNGNDTLHGGAGTDHIWGDSGDDHLNGGDATDYLYGGHGLDYLFGENGNDYLYGNDQACGADSTNYLYGGNDHDQIFGASNMDYLYGEAGNDTLHGAGGQDDLMGGIGNDTLYGGDGNDELFGEEGNDVLHGNNGDDYCRGGAGNDTVAGGAGIDELIGDVTASNSTVGFDELIFDAFDLAVDGLPGSMRWWACPKLTTGAYAGHSVHNG